MKIKILETRFENYNIDTTIKHEVIRTVIDDGDLFYVILDRGGKEFQVTDMMAEEIS
ncbi:hypothetical protein G9F71_016200 [Clostridium sp. FP2]|uniref:hypothetical protein n=1 Tax=Clostridium sp. FP2 TaxID=2724481 RepID=UPI0013E8FF11|nr:hypothetical protein [Clostridium sp. FP2]MBZ9624395.1 hypothetical protein [Clostridium sp. FP2]